VFFLTPPLYRGGANGEVFMIFSIFLRRSSKKEEKPEVPPLYISISIDFIPKKPKASFGQFF